MLFYLCTVDQVGAQDKNGEIILTYTLPFWKFSTIHCFLHLVDLLSPQFCTTLFFDLPAKQPSFEPLHHLNGIKQEVQFLASTQTNLEQNFLWFSALNFKSRTLSCTQKASSRAQWVRKLGWLSVHPRIFGIKLCDCMHAHPHHIPYQWKMTQSTGISTQMHDEVLWWEVTWPPRLSRAKNNKKVKSN